MKPTLKRSAKIMSFVDGSGMAGILINVKSDWLLKDPLENINNMFFILNIILLYISSSYRSSYSSIFINLFFNKLSSF